MKRSIVETALGAVVIIGAGAFLAFGYKTANVAAGADGYEITANFSGIGGLKAGDDVQISGVKVGRVAAVELDQQTFLARVRMDIDSHLKLPVDTAAAISSESLMGGKYLALEPGAEEETIPSGGKIEYTQAPQNLEQLLGKFIFSMKKDDKKDAPADDAQEEAAETPATEDNMENQPPSAPPQVAPSLDTPSPAPATDAGAAKPAEMPKETISPSGIESGHESDPAP